MKKTLLLCCAACILAACVNSIADEQTNETKEISFTVESRQPMTRTALTEVCNTLHYYRVTGNQTARQLTQNSEDNDFGTLTDELPYGTHSLYFIGHKGEMGQFDGGVASFNKVSDTFSHYMQLTVDKDTEPTQSIELLRRVAKFELVAKDALPEELKSVEITITGASTKLDVATGKGSQAVTQQKSITVPEYNIGKTGCTFAAYAFLLDDTATLTVNVTAKDATGNTIVSHTFNDVVMETDYITRYTGSLFGDGFTTSITAKGEWSGTNSNEF